jgi:imidazoleglycerol-phosphate dehydratase
MERTTALSRKTKETDIRINWCLDGNGSAKIATGIPFFDHMLTLFTAHGFFNLTVEADGDIDVDFHHTVEDVGLLLGDALNRALGDRKGIRRFGHAVTPMDETLCAVTVDLSNRPYLVFNVPMEGRDGRFFDTALAREFFRAFAMRAGMNLHINLSYGENEHHIIEAIFKSTGRALDQATGKDDRIADVRSTKGLL